MIWNDHHQFEGKHAFLSPSQYHWLNYTPEKLEIRYLNQFADLIGTTIHQLASDCIKARIKLHTKDRHLVEYSLHKAGVPKSCYDSEDLLETLILFVNDAIGFRMSSEIILFYSYNMFGTTDAIVYDERTKILRISDLKTGENPAKMDQLWVYAATFCLEYKIKPEDIKIILSIYQKGQVIIDEPDANLINNIMSIIVASDNQIKEIQKRG